MQYLVVFLYGFWYFSCLIGVKYMQNSCTILLSGGIDSFILANFLIGLERDIDALFIDYGQPSASIEFEASRNVSRYLNIPYKKIVVSGITIPEMGEIRARNIFLIALAVMSNHYGSREIALGIHTGTPYFDCSESFYNDFKKIIYDCTNQEVSLIAPLLNWTKPQLIKYAKDKNLPLDITYSCEKGVPKGCGQCLSCLDREGL